MNSLIFVCMMIALCFAESSESREGMDYEKAQTINIACISILVCIIAILIIVIVVLGLLKRNKSGKRKSKYQDI